VDFFAEDDFCFFCLTDSMLKTRVFILSVSFDFLTEELKLLRRFSFRLAIVSSSSEI